MYIVYIITENGKGFVQKIWEGDDITEFELFTDVIQKGCKLAIEYEV